MKDNQNVSARKLIDHLVPDPNWGAMQGLIATTFDLRPDFLETDFLPSVFGLGAWDDQSWATRIALEKRLFELDAAVILTEARRYRGRPRSLRLDVRPAVSPHGSAVHAKVTLLLFERAVRLIVGSANLTKQGYRENREVIAVLTATQKSKKEAALITQGLVGMESALTSWLTPEARKLIRRSIDTVQSWFNGNADPHTSFIWSNGQTRLWREFVARWPVGETVKRISILSPFWSQDASLTLSSFLAQLKNVGPFAPDAEVRLLTDAFKNPNGDLIPVLPSAYAAQDWQGLGVRATAQPVNPEVHPEELGGMEGFTATRALHAKVILVEGMRSGLAYLGSANFTGHGWGFIPGENNANTEAGVILRRSLQSSDFDTVLPDLIGQPIMLSNANIHSLREPEIGPADEPWPEFIRQVLLAPVTADGNKLELRIEAAADGATLCWSACLLEKDGVPGETLVPLEETQDVTKNVFSVSLSGQVLTRLLTDQEIQICWKDCPAGRSFPLNVEASARASLPISPGKQSIEENHLISYYQGRIAWEQLFPEPDSDSSSGDQSAVAAAISSGVDKSRIQSYQIREFVEALAGLNQDLRSATQSEPAMRLALLGPVSPFALAQTIIDAVAAGRRTPTAAGFQLVEILACLQSAVSHPVSERLADVWQQHLKQVNGKISRLLETLVADHPALFTSNKAFGRYRKAVLNGETTLKS
jgi:phosphatidylserine/phosphatidylglycerophosphate/cardiolipin synthase-like enzyme